jgi:multisubunit Na+/H+ antiporter MnhC subunit
MHSKSYVFLTYSTCKVYVTVLIIGVLVLRSLFTYGLRTSSKKRPTTRRIKAKPMPPSKHSKQPILTLRSTVLVLAAVVVGGAVAALTYVNTKELTGTILAGGAAFGAALLWFDKIVA